MQKPVEYELLVPTACALSTPRPTLCPGERAGRDGGERKSLRASRRAPLLFPVAPARERVPPSVPAQPRPSVRCLQRQLFHLHIKGVRAEETGRRLR